MKLISKSLLVLLSLTLFSCNGQGTKNIKTVEPKIFSEKITTTPDAQIIDVRTPEEFTAGHIDNALNIDFLDATFVTNIEKLDKSKPVFLYCKTNNRSQKAAKKLEELGFQNIYNLQGGLLKWDADGFSKATEKIIGVCPQEYAELLNTDKKVLINFYAEWCAPCKKMTPYILKMEKELADQVVIIRLNADENPTLVKEMKISELPTLILYENKQIKWQSTGYISEEDLRKKLD